MSVGLRNSQTWRIFCTLDINLSLEFSYLVFETAKFCYVEVNLLYSYCVKNSQRDQTEW